MSRSGNKRFALEALEPRVLLSADGMGAGVVAGAVLPTIDTTQLEVRLEEPLAIVSQSQLLIAPEYSSDIFGDSQGVLLVEPAVEPETPAVASEATQQPKSGTEMAGESAAQDPSLPNPEPEALVTLLSPGPQDTLSAAAQLVETLHAANAPPESTLPSQLQALTAIYTSELSLASTTSPGLVPVPFALFSDRIPALSSSSHSSLRLMATLDLQGFIEGKLAEFLANSSSGNSTFNLSDYTLGGFLKLSTFSVAFQNIGFTAGTFTGQVLIQTAAATFFDGQPFSIAIADGADADTAAISGSYAAGTKTYSLTLDQVSLTVGDAVHVTTSGVALSYDSTNLSASQTLATVASGTISSPSSRPLARWRLPDLPSAGTGSTSATRATPWEREGT